ncbi:MAG: substrate-binding domain-containing protein, partial [Caldisericia bacterium]|nr:substrate-binding domain-containing protein [Caldisericia bacterium]
MKKNLFLATGVVMLFSMIMISCTGKNPVIQEAKELSGAGATFPKVLYEKYFDNYNQQKQVQVNYQAVGSGAGINTLIEKTIDFGATDAPMKVEEEAKEIGRAS